MFQVCRVAERTFLELICDMNSTPLPNLTLARLVAIFAAVLVLALGTMLAIGGARINKLKIGGELYGNIVDGKDLVADVLPPPLYLVEAYLNAQRVYQHPDMLEIVEHELQRHQREYQERFAYSKDSSIPESIKSELLDSSENGVDVFWEAIYAKLLPAIKSGDRAAAAEAIDLVEQAFNIHRKNVLLIVNASNAYLKKNESDAIKATEVLMLFLVTMSALICLVLAGLFLALSRGVVTPLTALRQSMSELAAGDFEANIPSKQEIAEIASMARSLLVFCDAGLQKAKLEQHAILNRSQSEAERTTREAEKADQALQMSTAVQALGDGLSRLAHGDLMCSIDKPFTANLDRLRSDFNSAIGRLGQLLGVVKTTASTISSNTSDIAKAANHLSMRTGEHVNSLEETAQALNQITSTVNDTAANAVQAQTVVAQAKSVAETGARVVHQAIQAMGKIKKSSQKIDQIVGVMDEIAMQTNILALNASVEAARAGDAGRGFAVVASEVRVLAKRSAESANQIKELIAESTLNVEEGVSLVGKTAEAFDQIEKKVAEGNRAVHRISADTQEQASALQQINASIGLMDDVTQGNSATAQQTTAACERFSRDSAHLHHLVGQFKVREDNNASLRESLRGAAPHALRELAASTRR